MSLTRRGFNTGGLTVGTLALLSTAFNGRSALGQTSRSDSPPAMETVRVAYNPGTILRLYAALEGDLFKKHSVKVDLIRFESGAAASAAFASGSVDVGFTGIPGFLSSRLAGGKTRIFMIENDSGGAEGLVVRPQSGINSINDLSGKKIGTVIGTTSWMGLISALQEANVDPNGVKIENVPPGAWMPALQRGDVDGIFGWSPVLFMLEGAGNKIIATMSKYRRDPLLWQGRGDFLEKKPETVNRFVAALRDARHGIESRDEKFIARMSSETGANKAATIKTIDAIKLVDFADQVSDASPYSLTAPSGLTAQVNAWLGLYIEKGIFRQRPDLEDAVDPGVIRAVLKG